MREVRASGFLVVRGRPIESFLLLKHARRLDLPKGHADEGETDLQCALRELNEETGIATEDLEIDPDFQFAIDYHVRYRDFNHEMTHKTVTYFLARLKHEVVIRPTEHQGYVWVPWNPPHHLQRETVDPLLAAVEKHVAAKA